MASLSPLANISSLFSVSLGCTIAWCSCSQSWLFLVISRSMASHCSWVLKLSSSAHWIKKLRRNMQACIHLQAQSKSDWPLIITPRLFKDKKWFFNCSMAICVLAKWKLNFAFSLRKMSCQGCNLYGLSKGSITHHPFSTGEMVLGIGIKRCVLEHAGVMRRARKGKVDELEVFVYVAHGKDCKTIVLETKLLRCRGHLEPWDSRIA